MPNAVGSDSLQAQCVCVCVLFPCLFWTPPQVSQGDTFAAGDKLPKGKVPNLYGRCVATTCKMIPVSCLQLVPGRGRTDCELLFITLNKEQCMSQGVGIFICCLQLWERSFSSKLCFQPFLLPSDSCCLIQKTSVFQ